MEGLAACFTSISKIKYDYFKGTTSDDADSYVSQFESIANANNEGTDVDKLWIFLGLLRKQACIWYSQVEPGHVGTWLLLKDAFLNQFREIGYKSRILKRLNNVQKKTKESLRKYTRKVKILIGKLTGVYPVDMQIEWFLVGLPLKIDRYCRQGDMTSLAAVIASAENFETSKLARKRCSTKRSRKSKIDSSDSDDDSDSDSSTSSSSSESKSSDSSESEADKGDKKINDDPNERPTRKPSRISCQLLKLKSFGRVIWLTLIKSLMIWKCRSLKLQTKDQKRLLPTQECSVLNVELLDILKKTAPLWI